MTRRRRFPGRSTLVIAYRHGKKLLATVHVSGGGVNPFRKYHLTPASFNRLERLARALPNISYPDYALTPPCARLNDGRHLVYIHWRNDF